MNPQHARILADEHRYPGMRRTITILLVAGVTLFVPALQAKSYIDFRGITCVDNEIPNGAINFYDQSKFRPKNWPPTNDPSLARVDWAINDNFHAHLAPALKAMHTDVGAGRGGSVSNNLHFTLVRIPNHPKALAAIVDYVFEIKKRPRHQPLVNQPECYLSRAMDFAPKDPGPHSLMGVYLFRLKRYDEALTALDDAAKRAPLSSEIDYNRGLILFKMGRYDEAVDAARRAYRRGYPLSGLRRMLKGKGYSLDDAAAQPAAAQTPLSALSERPLTVSMTCDMRRADSSREKRESSTRGGA